MTKTSALVAALLLSSSVAAVHAETVKLGATPEWAPFTSDKVDGGGIVVAVAKQAFERAGYDAQNSFLPWSRVLTNVKDGSLDAAACMWPNDSTKADYVFTDPVVVNKIVFVKSAADSWEYDGISSLDGKSVAVMKDYSYSPDFDAATNFKKEEGTSFAGNLKKVALHRVDLTLDDEIVSKYTVSTELADMASKLAYTKNAVSEVNCVLAFSATNPKAAEVVAAFNKGLSDLKADGSYDKILASYGIK